MSDGLFDQDLEDSLPDHYEVKIFSRQYEIDNYENIAETARAFERELNAFIEDRDVLKEDYKGCEYHHLGYGKFMVLREAEIIYREADTDER